MRTLAEIQKAYAQRCADLGDLVYKQRVLHTRAESVIRDIEALDLEALRLQRAQEAESAAAAAETPSDQE